MVPRTQWSDFSDKCMKLISATTRTTTTLTMEERNPFLGRKIDFKPNEKHPRNFPFHLQNL